MIDEKILDPKSLEVKSAYSAVDGIALERFAKSVGMKVLITQSDIDPKMKVVEKMIDWCRKNGDMVVVADGERGYIITCRPMSDYLQNCKVLMTQIGLIPTKVIPAKNELVKLLLENYGEKQGDDTVTAAQQRLRTLVLDALKNRVTDIHIEVRTDVARVRFRKHGILQLYAEWVPKAGREVASVAFNKETDYAVMYFNPLIPQSASMPLVIGNKEVRLRLASLPAHGGFDFVMRVLDTLDSGIQSIDELGYTPTQKSIIKKAISMPHGAIIISGPTGSGKTTTMASCLSMVPNDCKVYTIEDPVEKVVPGITQVPVTLDQEDRGFASMGTAALRMDPDVIVLGEVRDIGTANVMVRAALTGHLVLCTLHTNSSIGIVTRLIDMGVSSTLLSNQGVLVCLISQRLLPFLCDHCSKSIVEVMNRDEETKELVKRWKDVAKDKLSSIRTRGRCSCNACDGLGIKGRTVASEIVWVDEVGLGFIKDGNNLAWEKYLRSHGWQSIQDNVIDKVLGGLCDPADAESVIGIVNPAFMSSEFDYNEHVDGVY